MDYLFWGQIFFLAIASLVWFIFWMFASYWKQKTISEVVVPSLYLFPYFFIASIFFLFLAIYFKYGVN